MAVAGSGALAIGMITATAAPASAATIACGTTITTNVTLSANIDCTADTTDNALIIGAAGITVDLNGYSILGPGYSAGTVGIADDPADTQSVGYSNLTVEDGTISNFGTDVDAEGTDNTSPPPACSAYLDGVSVVNVTATSTELEGDGFYGDCLSGSYIHRLSASDDEYGVYLSNSESSIVSYNHVQRPEFGLYDYEGKSNKWFGNAISGVEDHGIDLEGTTTDTANANTISGRGADGIYEEETGGVYPTGDTFDNNVLNDLYDGVYQDGASGDTVHHNKGSKDGWGLYADETTDNTYTDNQFDSNQYGIETDYPTGEVLNGNVASHNSDAGIDIYTNFDTTGGYSASLGGNTANYNRFGLYSQIPTAGSGNHASHNKVVNCHNVTCS